MTTLVLVHGRGQHGRNPDELRRSWAAGLNAGLTRAGRPTVDPQRLVFPFYGDLLETKKLQAIRAGSDLDLESAGALRTQRLDPLMPKGVAQLESDLVKSMAEQAGLAGIQQEGWADKILRIPGARKILQILAERTHVDQEIIEAFLTDVAVYFKFARKEVLALVRAALPPGNEPLVIIGHSLGSVVVHDLLRDTDGLRDRTTLLVTAGSPLGLQACYRNLLATKHEHPGVQSWLTAYDQDDFVALGHPLQRLYGDPLTDVRVDNPANQAHSIEQYLGHSAVASRIADSLRG